MNEDLNLLCGQIRAVSLAKVRALREIHATVDAKNDRAQRDDAAALPHIDVTRCVRAFFELETSVGANRDRRSRRAGAQRLRRARRNVECTRDRDCGRTGKARHRR
ncbi:MAG: hypothetical protein RIT81_37840 [Deltaproteobacteria bacterium]